LWDIESLMISQIRMCALKYWPGLLRISLYKMCNGIHIKVKSTCLSIIEKLVVEGEA
jgi:hypothetical protein